MRPRGRVQVTKLPDPRERFATPARQVPSLELGSPLPTFRARQKVTGFTAVPNGNFEEVYFDTWENGDQRIFEEELTVGSLLRIVRLKLPGWYSFGLAPSWANDFDGDVGIDFADGYENSEAFYYPRHAGQTNSDLGLTWTRSFPYFWPEFATPSGFSIGYMANCLFQLANFSGLDQDTEAGTSLEIAYLGGLSVEPWTAVI